MMMMERTILCLLHSGGIQLRKRITTREKEGEREKEEKERD